MTMTSNQPFGFVPGVNHEAVGAAFGAGQDWMQKATAVQMEWLDLCQGQTKRALEGAQALARCRDLNEGISLQADLVRGMVEAYTSGAQRIAAIWTEAATQGAEAGEAIAKAPFRHAAE